MKLKKYAAVLSASVLLCLSGCNITDFANDDLLRPPKTMGDEAEIEQLIAGTAANGYTLNYPKSGAYRSAIVMRDLNGDDVDEAIAFFREKDSAGVHMLVMNETEEKWKIAGDFVTETTDVDCVDFADIDDSSSLEILVGYSTYTSGVNFLSCYRYQDGKMSEIKSGQNYSAFYCGALEGGGKSKVITLSLFTPENEAKATMLDYNKDKNELFAKASAPMDPNIVSYKNVVFSDLSDGAKGIAVDGALTNGELNTQVIYFNKELNVLRNPLYKEKTANPTRRNSSVLSAELSNDMSVKIPTVSALPFSESTEAFTAADQVVWNSFSVKGEALVPDRRTAADYSFSFTIKIPDAWVQGSFTALLNESGDLMSFRVWDKNHSGASIFDIRVFKVSDWEAGKGSGYTLIYKDNRYAYTFLNSSEGSAFAVSDDEIKTAFSVMSNTAASSSKAQ